MKIIEIIDKAIAHQELVLNQPAWPLFTFLRIISSFYSFCIFEKCIFDLFVFQILWVYKVACKFENSFFKMADFELEHAFEKLSTSSENDKVEKVKGIEEVEKVEEIDNIEEL